MHGLLTCYLHYVTQKCFSCVNVMIIERKINSFIHSLCENSQEYCKTFQWLFLVTILTCPFFAAMWSGLCPFLSSTSTCAPLTTSILATSSCPFSAARCTGYLPAESWQFTYKTLDEKLWLWGLTIKKINFSCLIITKNIVIYVIL